MSVEAINPVSICKFLVFVAFMLLMFELFGGGKIRRDPCKGCLGEDQQDYCREFCDTYRRWKDQ